MDFLSILSDANEGTVQSKKTPLPDYHLRNPIQPLIWYDDKARRTSRTKEDCVHIERLRLGRKFEIGNPEDLNNIGDAIGYPEMSSHTFDSVIKVLQQRIAIDDCIFPGLFLNPSSSMIDILKSVECHYWDGMRFWGSVLTIMNAMSSKRKTPTGINYADGCATVGWGAYDLKILKTSVCLLDKGKNIVKLYDGDWVRMTSDTMTQRFLVSLGTKVGVRINPNQYCSYNTVESIVKWGDNVIKTFGNDGFKLLKAYEALVVGEIQSRGEGKIIDPNRFLSNTRRDLFDSDPNYEMHIIKLLDILKKVENPHHLTQLYGMHRIWGHPRVQSRDGMEKVIKIGRKNIIKDEQLSKNAGRMFKLIFAREYKKRHGCYPPIYESITPLGTSISEGSLDAVSPHKHALEEWDRIRFKQIFQLPETFNLSMIVADKSISPTHSELINIIKRKRTVMDPDKRRGVKRWLEDKTLNPRDLLRDINNGEFPDDHKIIGLTPKERELNPVPRMFALMSHLLRVYVVLTEQLISDHVLKYFPQITMTDTLLDLTKKMYATVKSQSCLNRKRGNDKTWASRVVCLSLDFEKWNGHMRKDMTLGVFTAMGEIFGLSEIFNCTYDIFSECYYYLADGTYVPRVVNDKLMVEEPYSFRGHKGGMEGLRQKGWTVFTVCGLEVVLSRHNCTYKIMGMGDNQVLQVTLYTNRVDEMGNPTDEGLSDMRLTLDNIFHDLVTSFTSAGLPLKPLETWMSEDLFLYGKVPVWKGVPLSMDLKKIMRMFPFSNAEVMTLENALSTISGNALSSTQSTVSIGVPYVMALFMSSLCIIDFLEYHPLLGQGMLKAIEGTNGWTLSMGKQGKHVYKGNGSHRFSLEQIVLAVQLIPRTLMGYNGINPLEMTMRGFPDNLSRDVSYLFSICKAETTPKWMRVIIENWLSPIYMPSINYSTLLQDVTAVNLLSPRSPSSGIKQVVTQYMTSGVNIKNQEFKDLMLTKHKTHEEFLSELLCSGPDLHVRLLHDIIEASVYGYVDSILSKVVKTTTIQRLAMRTSDRDVFDVIESDEKIYLSYFLWRCNVRGDQVNLNCPTAHCKKMRLEGWQKNLRGITIPHPHSFMSITNCSHKIGCDCDDGYMSVTFPDDQMTDKMWFESIGGCPPYLGSMTKEKVVIGAGGKVYSSEPLIKRPLNLLRIINWFVPPESNTSSVIKALVSSVTDLDPEPHVGLREGAAGAEVHRYKDSSTTHGALTSSSYLFSTRYHISSDHFHRYCRGSENTDMHFQALYCYILEMTNLRLLSSMREEETMPRFSHYKQICYDCIHAVSDDFVDIESDRAVNAIPSRKGNPYLFVEQHKIRVLEERSPLSHVSEDEFTSTDYEKMSESRRRYWLQEIIAYKVAGSIYGEILSDTEDEDTMLNIASFERTMYLKIDPKDMIDTVMGIIARVAEWKWLDFTGHHKPANKIEIIRLMLTIIKKAPVGAFLGLGMFFCWKETADRFMNTYAEVVAPTTNPISVNSACSAVKDSLLSLCYKKVWMYKVRASPISYDERSNIFVFKNILYQFISETTICLDCKRLITGINDGAIRKLGVISCKAGHKPFDKIAKTPWRKSNVTIERLRKDCDSILGISIHTVEAVPRLNHDYVFRLFVGSRLLGRPDTAEIDIPDNSDTFDRSWYNPSHPSLLVPDPLPTRTRSKYIPLFSCYRRKIFNKKIFLLGDGLGTTSVILSMYKPKGITSSTILDIGTAIPQTYVHNSPSAWAGLLIPPEMDCESMTTKPNNFLDKRWGDAWKKTVEDHDILISDAELINAEGSSSFIEGLTAVVSLKDWEFIMFKMYIYSCRDFSELIRIMTSIGPREWSIVTTPFRSAHYPEVWIIATHTRQMKDKYVRLTYSYNQLLPHWRNLLGGLRDTEGTGGIIIKSVVEDIFAMASKRTMQAMVTRARAWLTLPTVGLVFPDRLGFMTRVSYYLQKAQLPEYVKYYRGKSHLKLYDSSYYRLRDILLCVALSMVESMDSVKDELKTSDRWYLHWEERRTDRGVWDCVLTKSESSEGKRAEIDDYVSICRLMYKRLGLPLYKLGSSVRFNNKKKDQEEVQFNVSKRSKWPVRNLFTDSRDL